VSTINSSVIGFIERYSGADGFGKADSSSSKGFKTDVATSLKSTILAAASASRSTQPHDDAMLAIDALANIAARHDGPNNTALEELLDIYKDPAASNLRNDILNRVNAECRRQFDARSAAEPPVVAPGVAYLAARAEDPPDGPNGEAFRDVVRFHLASGVPALASERDGLLDPARRVTADEVLALSATMKSIGVHEQPVMANDLEGVKEQVARRALDAGSPMVIWVDHDGALAPIVAHPQDDRIAWHDLKGRTAVAAGIALKELDAEFSKAGPGGKVDVAQAIEAFDREWSEVNPDAHAAQELAARAELIEAAAVVRMTESPRPLAIPLPAGRADVTLMRKGLDKQKFTSSPALDQDGSTSVYSEVSGRLSQSIALRKALNRGEATREQLWALSDEVKGMDRGAKKLLDSSVAFATAFDATRSSALFHPSRRDVILNPLFEDQQTALKPFGQDGESFMREMLADQRKLLEKCHAAARAGDPSRMKRALDEIAGLQLANQTLIDNAIAKLELVSLPYFENRLRLAGIGNMFNGLKDDATALIQALQQLRKCVTGKISEDSSTFEPNVYTELVAFASEGLKSPEGAIELFRTA
jgi:hypothetical protein